MKIKYGIVQTHLQSVRAQVELAPIEEAATSKLKAAAQATLAIDGPVLKSQAFMWAMWAVLCDFGLSL